MKSLKLHKNLAALVVEDNPTNLTTISYILKSSGFEVDEATTCSEAKEFIWRKEHEGKKYNLLFCDTSLPFFEKELEEDYPDNTRGCGVGKLFKEKSPNGVIISMSSDEKLKENWKNISDEFYKSPLPQKLIYTIKKKFNLE